MAFEPKTWADGEEGGTPITAAELNRIETGIAEHKHDAGDIDSGTLAAARIPTLSQSKVTGLAALVTRIEALEQKVEALEPDA